FLFIVCLYLFFIFFLLSLFLVFYLIDYSVFCLEFFIPYYFISEIPFSFSIDYVSLFFFSAVSLISRVVFLYSKFYMEDSYRDLNFLYNRFFYFLFFFVVSMLFFVFFVFFFVFILWWVG